MRLRLLPKRKRGKVEPKEEVKTGTEPVKTEEPKKMIKLLNQKKRKLKKLLIMVYFLLVM